MSVLNRLYPLATCFLLTLCLATSYGAPSRNAPEEDGLPELTDRQVLSYLSNSEVLEWERASDQLAAGQSQIETGNRMISRPPSPLKSAADIARDKEAGQQIVTQGEAVVAQAQMTLDKLRQKAATKAQSIIQTPDEPALYSLDIKSAKLDELLLTNTEQLLFKLWNAGYSRIFVDSFYVIDTAQKAPEFVANDDWEQELRDDISRLDGNRFTYVNQEVIFEYKKSHRGNYLDFADRDLTLKNFKSALIIAELVLDSRLQSVMLSIRGIDLATGQVVAAQLLVPTYDTDIIAFIPKAETKTAKTPDAPQGPVAHEEEVPTPTPVAQEEAVPATPEASTTTAVVTADEPVAEPDQPSVSKHLYAKLKDDNRFIERLTGSNAPYVFTIEYVGDTSGFTGRSASMITKVILLENGVSVSDQDFLNMALNPDNGGSWSQEPDTNAVWKITPLVGSSAGRSAYDIQAISLTGGKSASVSIGLLESSLVQEDSNEG